MTHNLTLVVLVLIPLAGSVVIFSLNREQAKLAKLISLAVSLVVVAYTGVVAVGFNTGANAQRFQYTGSWVWIRDFGVHLAFGVDGIALVLVAMSVVLVPAVILASWNSFDSKSGAEEIAAPDAKPRSVKNYFALLLLLEFFMIGVFTATDVFLFYVFFEAMLVPMYFIIGGFGGPRRQYAAMKFFLYSLVGGLLMLASVIGLYVTTGSRSFAITDLIGRVPDNATQKWLFLGFFIAFAIKAPVWPFHTWLPDAAESATPGTSVLLLGVLDKVGTFGMIRYCLTLFPHATKTFTPVILVLAVISIIYGAFLAIGQTDFKRLIAYTSISHFGFITMGIFAMTSQGQSGATLYMFNHGFSTAALFLVAGWMSSRRGSSKIADFGGLQRVTPVMAWVFFFAGMSSLALPGLSSFVSEFLVLVGTYTRYPVAAVIGAFGIVLAALYILIPVQRALHGPVTEGNENLSDLNGREKVAIAPVVAVILVLGFYPSPLLRVINPAAAHSIAQAGFSDPLSSIEKAGK